MQLQEEFENFVVHIVRVGVFAVDLIDDDNGLEVVRQRFLEHKPGLRLRAIKGIDQQQDAIDHLQNPFHFAAEVGMAGGVDNVDEIIFPVDGGVLGLDGDTFFFFKVHRVHCPFFHRLAGAVHTALAEQFVHKRRFAVVNVRDNSNIANLLVHSNSRRGNDERRQPSR